ncbi:hypothetical protein ES708_21513 [subsurface metagenome]
MFNEFKTAVADVTYICDPANTNCLDVTIPGDTDVTNICKPGNADFFNECITADTDVTYICNPGNTNCFDVTIPGRTNSYYIPEMTYNPSPHDL